MQPLSKILQTDYLCSVAQENQDIHLSDASGIKAVGNGVKVFV